MVRKEWNSSPIRLCAPCISLNALRRLSHLVKELAKPNVAESQSV